jgi:hypothetical protein
VIHGSDVGVRSRASDRQLAITCGHRPSIHDLAAGDDRDLAMQGHSRADMARYGVRHVAGLVAMGLRRLQDQMLFVVVRRLGIGQVGEMRSYVNRRIGRDGFVTDVERYQIRTGPADTARQHQHRRGEIKVREFQTVMRIMQNGRTRAGLDTRLRLRGKQRKRRRTAANQARD